ncbi:MAG TPA: hypothetical protein VFA81_07980 [Burkholderiales bacterium]|nr:hypothetical protein [Burkholderiales bacterium]
MNAKLISLTIAAILASTGAYAGQSNGRDSVYAQPGVTSGSAKTAIDNGRSSVYAKDVKLRPVNEARQFRNMDKAGRA